MTQEALKLALDYLESRGLAWNVQIALREALREHAMREVQRLGQEIEQEPVAWLSTDSIGERHLCFDKPLDNDPVQPLYTTPPKPEPVAYWKEHAQGLQRDYDSLLADFQAQQEERNFCPRCGKRTKDIHTCTPPQQKPVELCQYGQEPASCTSSPMDCQCAIDAALAKQEQEQKPVADAYTFAEMRFVVCPNCGNKRCPKANDHRNDCTNSNEVGQKGSSWEHVKPLAQPEQEPVAKVVCNSAGQISMQTLDGNSFDISKYVGSMFYTTPPQRTWVGLTDEEKSELWEISRAALPRYATYASLVEAKLKEKNT